MTIDVTTDVLSEHSDALVDFVAHATTAGTEQRRKAVDLYYAVRDGINYEVFGTDLTSTGMLPSSVLHARRGFCLHKSILYAAAVREVGINSTLMCSRVRNHLSSPALHDLVGGEVFLHWYTRIELDGRWVKATPVFNKLLCRMYRIPPLEFDGTTDSIDHPADSESAGTMEFLDDAREFTSVDPAVIFDVIAREHPLMCPVDRIVPPESIFLAG